MEKYRTNIINMSTMSSVSERSISGYRTHMKIIGDILSTTRDETLDKNGASVTFLIRKANVSHVRISKILTILVSQGLLEQVDSKNACRYKISSVGREFLDAYQTFSKFATNFGLTI